MDLFFGFVNLFLSQLIRKSNYDYICRYSLISPLMRFDIEMHSLSRSLYAEYDELDTPSVCHKSYYIPTMDLPRELLSCFAYQSTLEMCIEQGMGTVYACVRYLS